MTISSNSEAGTSLSRFWRWVVEEWRERLDLEKEARVPLDWISISQKLNAAPESPIINLVQKLEFITFRLKIDGVY